jgi:hypothetical protein
MFPEKRSSSPDTILYDAKRVGRDRVRIAGEHVSPCETSAKVSVDERSDLGAATAVRDRSAGARAWALWPA